MTTEAKSSQKTTDAIEELEAEIERLKSALDEALSRGEDMVHEGAENLRERFEEGTEEIEDHISAHPIRSVLIALGVGLVLGRLFGR